MANILIADEDDAVRRIIKILLRQSGHQATGVSDGRTALKVFAKNEFDLLIVDIFMPGMDGLEIMKQVHADRPSVPIIMMSGHSFPARCAPSPDFLNMATKLGAACSLQKPFRSAVLLERIAACLGHLPALSHTKFDRVAPANLSRSA